MPRLLFEKTGTAIYISHLDLMRVFQRAFRRAGIPLWHSQGFNPRAHVSIALPLSVGTESLCELLDFDLAEGFVINLEEIPEKLNRTMPDGVRVKAVWEQGRKLRELTHLDGELILEYDRGVPENCARVLTDFFARQVPIVVTKKGKSGMTETDIRPMLLSFAAEPLDENRVRATCRVCAQNPSLNPALLVTAMEVYLKDYAPDFALVRRLEVRDSRGEAFR